MYAYLLIGLGSAIGGVARAGAATAVTRLLGGGFPWGTILVNITGSALIGLVAALPAVDGRPFLETPTGQFLAVGICGGYTTFSAFSLQTLALLQQGRLLAAAGNVALSLVACLLAVWAGYALGSLARG